MDWVAGVPILYSSLSLYFPEFVYNSLLAGCILYTTFGVVQFPASFCCCLSRASSNLDKVSRSYKEGKSVMPLAWLKYITETPSRRIQHHWSGDPAGGQFRSTLVTSLLTIELSTCSPSWWNPSKDIWCLKPWMSWRTEVGSLSLFNIGDEYIQEPKPRRSLEKFYIRISWWPPQSEKLEFLSSSLVFDFLIFQFWIYIWSLFHAFVCVILVWSDVMLM